jgi:sugar phosphate isomerase/epimerase
VLGAVMMAFTWLPGCVSGPKTAAAPSLELVAVAADGTGFVEHPSGRRFIPFGTNYYDPNTGWAPKVWQQFDPNEVARHFEIMAVLGVNCARVFLAAAAFQPDIDEVDEEALARLDQLIEIARAARIRLILTGPDHWEGRPGYWKPDRFAGEEALRALEHFWRVVGRRYRGEPAILAWDLLNEPQMPWFVEGWQTRWNAWLQAKYGDRAVLEAGWAGELQAEETWGRIAIPPNKANPGNRRLLDWQMFREHLADEWVRRQVEVLREVDPTHLVTVGYIQWSYPGRRPAPEPGYYSAFNPRRQKVWLDFVSIHFYPQSRPYASQENWDRNLAYLQSVLAYCHVGKPVVLGEYGWYGGGQPQNHPRLSEAEQARWIDAEIDASRRLAAGWLSWPFADTPASTDISIYAGLVRSDMSRKLWGRRFQSYAAALDAVPQPTPNLPDFDFAPALTAPPQELLKLHQEYAAMVTGAIEKARPAPRIKDIERTSEAD